MKTAELKAKAKESLKGKWGKAALVVLCYVLIIYGINFVLGLLKNVGEIISIIINIPIVYGFVVSFMKLKNGEEVKYTGFLTDGFGKFGTTWRVYGNVLLKLIVPTILIVVSIIMISFSGVGIFAGVMSENNFQNPNSVNQVAATSGILLIIGLILLVVSLIWEGIKSLNYSLVWYILKDNPEMSAKDIVKKSEMLMKNNKWNIFYLQLTFIGWQILNVFTFGIGTLWLAPYIGITSICFYEKLLENNNNVVVENEVLSAKDEDLR